jgi:hypothetical protein
MKNEDNLNVECSGCGAKMTNADFNQHNCPATIPPRKGESFADYKARGDRWKFVPSDDIEQADDNFELKGTNFSVQVCTFGRDYWVNEDLLDVDGTWVTHKECETLDEAIAFVEAKQTIAAHDLIFNKDANGYAYLTYKDGQEVLDEWVEQHADVSDAFFVLA